MICSFSNISYLRLGVILPALSTAPVFLSGDVNEIPLDEAGAIQSFSDQCWLCPDHLTVTVPFLALLLKKLQSQSETNFSS